MTKLELNEYIDLKHEVEYLTERLEEIHTRITRITPMYSDMPKGIQTDLDEYKLELISIKETLKIRKIRLFNKLNQLEQFISNIPTSKLRMIFTMKYIDSMTYRQIAIKLNMSEEGVRIKLNRYLHKT